jgi:M6 family metalloprotease-like protein
MKRILWGLILIFLMSACTVPEQQEPVIDNEIVQDENEFLEEPNDEISDSENDFIEEPEEEDKPYSGPINALLSPTLTHNLKRSFETQFEVEFNGYNAFNPETISNYQRVIVFYNQTLENQLRESGYDWPELEPEEAIRVVFDEIEWIFVNHTNTLYRIETIELFLNHHQSIGNEVISLTSFYPQFETDLSVLVDPLLCQIDDKNKDSVRVGFPNSLSRLPSQGEINVQVLFIDFPDQVGTKSDKELEDFFEDYTTGIEKFFEDQSLGRVQFDWYLEPGFVRIPRNFNDLRMTRDNSVDLDSVLRQAVDVSDAKVDYSNIDMIIVFLNPDIPEELADVSPAWPLEGEGGIKTAEKTIFNATFIAGDAVRIGYPIIAHEIGHLFGLVDLYKYNWLDDNPQRDQDRQFEFVGVFDFMNIAPPSHQYGDNRDMLGWQRYLLDWITDDEIHCLSNEKSSVSRHLLTPVAEEGGTRMVVTRLSETQVLVTELKTKNPYCELCSGGVYHYLVDTTIRNGQGPIQMLRPEHSSMNLFQDAYISLGQTFNYENVTVQFEDTIRDQVIVSIEIKDID